MEIKITAYELQMIESALATDIRLRSSYINKTREQEILILQLQNLHDKIEEQLLKE